MPTELLAYIDPGLGAMAYQALLASVLGALFYVSRAWRWLFTRARRVQPPPADRAPGERAGEP